MNYVLDRFQFVWKASPCTFSKLLLVGLAVVSCVAGTMTGNAVADSANVRLGQVNALIRHEIPTAPEGFSTSEDAMQAIRQKVILPIDQSTEFPDVEVKRNLRYSDAAGERGVLDLYSSKNAELPRIGVVLVHGGGWRAGAKEDYRYYGQQLAHRGFVAACINYRLVPQARFPAQIQDVKCAVRWLRANASELNVDPERIAIMGGSAGGHLSMMAGYASEVSEFENVGGNPEVSSQVQAVLNIYGPVDFSRDFENAAEMVPDMIREFLGADAETAQRNVALASPVSHLDESDPPTLIIHGTIDRLVPVQQADSLAEKLEALKIPFVYDRLTGWPHGMDIARPVNDRVLFFVENFLTNTLRATAAEAVEK